VPLESNSRAFQLRIGPVAFERPLLTSDKVAAIVERKEKVAV
jgi:hypothetical protein